MELLPNEHAQYSALIDDILAYSDLQLISAKQIRKQLQAKVPVDLTERKEAVQALILERFDHASNMAAAVTAPKVESSTNGSHSSTEVNKENGVKAENTPPNSRAVSPPPAKSEPDSDVEDAPPKKKRKTKEVDDAKLAAMLQAQENRSSRATRGAGSKATKAKTPKKPRKKSEKKVKAEDDSELEVGSDGEVKEKPKKGGFHKEYYLSAPLADLVQATKLSRPQVVKQIWVYIKANNLQDPADKRQIMCDEKMQLVFKSDKVHMFTMNKLLGKQLYEIEDE